MDGLEVSLGRTYANGRLFRLLCMLGFINERPDENSSGGDAWSETGDRYLLKLFRDYVFHQVGKHNQPMMDMMHVVETLNKLDAGTDENILLTSRDRQAVLVVTPVENNVCGASCDLVLRLALPLTTHVYLPPFYLAGFLT